MNCLIRLHLPDMRLCLHGALAMLAEHLPETLVVEDIDEHEDDEDEKMIKVLQGVFFNWSSLKIF